MGEEEDEAVRATDDLFESRVLYGEVSVPGLGGFVVPQDWDGVACERYEADDSRLFGECRDELGISHGDGRGNAGLKLLCVWSDGVE